MQRNRTIVAAKIAAGLAVVPVLIYAYASGPDPRHTGAPGDDPAACTTSGCHVGTALNGGGGSVQLTSSTGTTYTPGQSQTLTVTITDSRARVYGFQMTARLDSNPANGQAGDFTPGAQQIVICDDGSLKSSRGCPANQSVQFIEHSSPFTKNTITVQWTPPATDVGPITIYVAANAANGDASNTGDHIYTTKLQLTPPGGKPTISAAISASAFDQKAPISPGTWVEIYGQNLSSTTRGWAGSDFKGNNAPTSLDGVSVTIGGKSAFVDFVSPGQVNAQAPDGIPLGPGIPVVLTNPAGSSESFTVETASLGPALLAPPQWNVGNKQFVVAQFTDLAFVGRAGMVNGVTMRPAKSGDVITIYGIGFGPVKEGIGAGAIADKPTTLSNTPVFRFGETTAEVLYGGLAPGFVGLYQFNIKVPNVGSGDHPLNVTAGGTALKQTLFITTQ